MLEKLIVKPINRLSSEEILDLCTLKEQHWPLGIKKQLGHWFMLTNKEDKLIFMERKNKKIGFLRLKQKKIVFNNYISNSYMVSELCVDKKFQRRGLGEKILNKSQEIIYMEKAPGYLLSNKKYEKFYSQRGWVISKDIYIMEKNNSNQKKLDDTKICFFYNLKDYSKKITLLGKIF